MALITFGGKLLIVDGKLAVSTDCCCEEQFCEGCTGTTDIASITVEIDASGATGNSGAIVNGCDDADCQDLSGTYTLDHVADSGITTCGITITSGCTWEMTCDSGISLPCVTNTFTDVMYICPMRVWIGEASGTWYIVVEVGLIDLLPGGSGPVYYWVKSLGESKPTCDSIFPITLDDADYCEPTGFSETLTATCFYSSGVSLTVDVV